MKTIKFKTIFILCLFVFTLLLSSQKEEGKFLGAKETSMPEWFLDSFLDINEDIEELKENNKRLILYIHQNSCPYCHKFVNVNLKDKKTKENIQKNFAIIDINMFGDKEITYLNGKTYSEKEFAKEYKLQFTPTLIFFNEKKQEILRLNGYIPLKKFNHALDYIKNKQEKLLSFTAYLKKVTKQTKIIKTTHKLFTKNSKDLRVKNKKLAVFFEYENCLECEKLHKFFSEDKTLQELLKDLDLAYINMDVNQAIIRPDKIIQNTKEWIKKLKITYNPSIIFFDTKGAEIIRIEANFKTFHLQSIINYVTSDAYKTQKEFQRYLTQRAHKIRQTGKDVNIDID